jgi:hypothetical protein
VHPLADVEVDVAVLRHRRRARLARAVQVPGRDRTAADQREGDQLAGGRETEVRRHGGGRQAERHHQQVEGAGGQLRRHRDAGGDPPERRDRKIHSSSLRPPGRHTLSRV